MRLLLRAYPPSFRREFGEQIAQCAQDLRRHAGRPPWRIALYLLADTARTAPRIRLESAMKDSAVVTVGLVGALVVLALAVGSPALAVAVLAAIAAIAVLTVAGLRHDRPLATHRPTTARRRLMTGLACIAAGLVILIIDGGELSEPVWAVWATVMLTGLVLVLHGLLLGLSRTAERRSVGHRPG